MFFELKSLRSHFAKNALQTLAILFLHLFGVHLSISKLKTQGFLQYTKYNILYTLLISSIVNVLFNLQVALKVLSDLELLKDQELISVWVLSFLGFECVCCWFPLCGVLSFGNQLWFPYIRAPSPDSTHQIQTGDHYHQ